MKKNFKKYVWLFEWIATALVIAVAFIIGFVPGVVLMATGILLVIIGLLRVIPLFKTLNDNLMKWVNAIEILANIAVGVTMLVMVVNSWNDGTTVELGKTFSYLLGGILYVRGVIFFLGTSLRGEHTDIGKYIAHILFLTLGTYFVVSPTTDVAIGYFVMAIAILCAIYIMVDGIINYNNYRHEYASELEIKKLQKQEKAKAQEEKRKRKTDEVVEPTTVETPVGDAPVEEVPVDAPVVEEVVEDPATDSDSAHIN